MGELRKVEHQVGCGILDELQGFDGTIYHLDGGLAWEQFGDILSG
jgi:hypothetical protein